MSHATPLIEMRDIHLAYGGVKAVDGVSLNLYAGEVVGLLGHNGAGKSTLMRILSGAIAADSGEIRVNGTPVTIASPREARRHNIETIHQTLALADTLDAAANLFLGRELVTPLGFLDERTMQAETRRIMARLNPAFDRFDVPVHELSGGQRQSVAIARAIRFEARVLIMDEPTAALGVAETRMVGDLVRQLKSEGIGIFLISHDIHDVLGLCDRVAVLKNGRLIGCERVADVTEEDLLGMIILGRKPADAPGSATVRQFD